MERTGPLPSSGVKAATALAASASANGVTGPRVAAHQALSEHGGEAGLILAFVSSIEPAAAAAELAAAAEGVPCIGITGKGAIASDRFVEEGCSILALDRSVGVGIGIREAASANLRESAREASREALDAVDGRSGRTLLLLLLDTPHTDQADAVAGAYDAAGPHIPLAGGGAGGPAPAQLVNGRAIREAVVAIALKAPRGVGVGTRHGCRAMASPSIVTRSEGLVLTEIDGRPATEVYLERLGYGGMELDDDEFEALAVTHPLAQPELNGDTRLRHVRWREGSGLACATHLPAGAAVEFTHQSPDDIVAAAGAAVRDSIAALDQPPGAAIIFDCAGRRSAIGGALGLESSALLGSFRGASPPLAGAFTYGEVARARGAKGDRNHAVVVAALA